MFESELCTIICVVRCFITKPCPCYRGGPRFRTKVLDLIGLVRLFELPGSASSSLVMLGFSVHPRGGQTMKTYHHKQWILLQYYEYTNKRWRIK